MVFPRYFYVGPTDQLLIHSATSTAVFNGPGKRFCKVGEMVIVRPALLLDKLSFAKVQNTVTGDIRVEKGPQLLFLGAYDNVMENGSAVSLSEDSTTYLLVENTLTGEQRVIKGPCVFIPDAYERIVRKQEAIALKLDEYICIKDQATGQVWVEKGPKLVIVGPTHRLLFTQPRKATSLRANEYIHLLNKVTGQVRLVQGEQMIFPGDMEEIVGGEKRQAIDLKVYEYVKILNSHSGEIRVERGEQIVFLLPSEQTIGGVKEAVEVNAETAILVKNRSSGHQRLVTTSGLFFPSAHEEIIEVRKLQTLADYEVMVLRDKEGAFSFFHGASSRAEEGRAFFVPPHSEIVTLVWSRGRRREKRDMSVKKIDCRPQYMSFEFNCRTSDNVELILDGTFFWQIVDVPLMVQNTGDATGDICNHARSQFIQLISKVTLQTFMSSFNTIAKQAHVDDDDFYRTRGVAIHSLEVTGYRCADASTSKILENIVQETTNRINRLSVQESENEVKMHRMKGDIEQANLNSDLLEIKLKHLVEEARVEGTAEAEKLAAFLDTLASQVPDKDMRVAVWNTLRKNDAIKRITQGTARVYFTPSDCNLSIEHRS